MEIKGIVNAISQKEKGYGVNVNDTWLNDFGTCPVQKGDYVAIRYETKGDFKNIKEIRIEKEKPEITKPYGEQEVVIDKRGRKEYDKDPVGLAVEMYNQMLISATASKADFEYEKVMNIAIKVIKQAQKAFS